MIVGIVLAILVVWVGIPTIQGQDTSGWKLEFSYYPDPMIEQGAAGEWDSGFVWAGDVYFADGLFHMFYLGGLDWDTGAVGYATSEDGLHWTKYAGNPILTLDEAITPYGIDNFAVLPDGDAWMMYLAPKAQIQYSQGGHQILRATATSPTGPWTLDETPLIEKGERGSYWDSAWLRPYAALHTPDGYFLYYIGSKGGIGVATSPDGLTWTKYDNPDTTSALYKASDPILLINPAGWDDYYVDDPTVRWTENGYEMFYDAWGDLNNTMAIGYATSSDGIHWTRYGDTSILPPHAEHYTYPAAMVMVDDTYYLYYATASYDVAGNWTGNFDTRLITGTITRE
ncbi:MAG TPA: hypothetical protein VHP83_03240 [Aggregatilineaceae bacterium]|nr:hypothetical protein [Aggregatilineaceae bacterium]